jgi:hypothetical protein
VYGGDIYKNAGGTGAFTAQSAGTSSWCGISVNSSNGDVWACVYEGDIYKQTMGLNQSGGNITLSTGLGTGNSNPSISFVASTPTTSGATNQSASEKMRITGQGYLGINTTTPQFYMDLNGTSRIAGANALYFGGSVTSASDYGSLIYNSSGSLIHQPRVNATIAFTFQNADGTANVLNINTTNPSIAIGATQTTVNGTSGSVIFSEPETGSAVKRVIIYFSAETGAVTYTFPVAFTHTPSTHYTDDVTLASAVITSKSTTSVTVTGAATTGFIELIGF